MSDHAADNPGALVRLHETWRGVRQTPRSGATQDPLGAHGGAGFLDSSRPLPEVPLGWETRLAANEARGLLRQRLVDLGFTPGTNVKLVRRGPRGNLIAVSIRNTMIALRSEEARSIIVSADAERS